MTSTNIRSRETREMRLVTRVIAMDGEVPETSLPQFIARRRQPESDQWCTWDEIMIQLHGVTGETFSDVSLRRWASRYGIPEGTAMTGGPVTPQAYQEAITAAGIEL